MVATVAGIHLGLDTHANRPAGNAVPDGSIYSCSTHSLIYRSNYAGNSWATWATLGTVGGSVATDAIWDAAGDLAVGSGADTAAKLGIGAVGAHLSRINGAVAWDSGTSFPTAASGDRYYRTDVLGGIECVYDGTRWLGPLMREGIGGADALSGNVTSALTPGRWAAWSTDFDLWLVAFYVNTFVNGTNTGAAYWTLTFGKVNVSNVATSLGTVDTSADTASNWTNHKLTVGAAYSPSSFPGGMQVLTGKTGAPAALYFVSALEYRLIVT